jgi:hypothetical protein
MAKEVVDGIEESRCLEGPLIKPASDLIDVIGSEADI